MKLQKSHNDNAPSALTHEEIYEDDLYEDNLYTAENDDAPPAPRMRMSSRVDGEYGETVLRHIKKHLDERYNTHADASSHAFSALYKSARLRTIFVTEGEGGRFASFVHRACVTVQGHKILTPQGRERNLTT